MPLVIAEASGWQPDPCVPNAAACDLLEHLSHSPERVASARPDYSAVDDAEQ